MDGLIVDKFYQLQLKFHEYLYGIFTFLQKLWLLIILELWIKHKNRFIRQYKFKVGVI